MNPEYHYLELPTGTVVTTVFLKEKDVVTSSSVFVPGVQPKYDAKGNLHKDGHWIKAQGISNGE